MQKTNLSQIQDNKEQISLLQGLKRKHEAEIDTQNKVLAERERKLQRTEKDLSTATRYCPITGCQRLASSQLAQQNTSSVHILTQSS